MKKPKLVPTKEQKDSLLNPIRSYREFKLRKIASGEGAVKATAEALFGDSLLSEIIGKFGKQESAEEQQSKAREELEKKYGVKFKQSEENKNKSQFVAIRKTIVGLKTALKSIAKDTKTILETSNKILESVGKIKSTDSFEPSDMKPKTLTLEEKEYLYYPSAPEGRQIYEKSKKGTAGRIASKKVQKQLKKPTSASRKKSAKTNPLENKQTDNIKEVISKQILEKIVNNSSSAEKIVENSSSQILNTVEKIISEKISKNEENIGDILRKLSIKQQTSEMEPDEQKQMLEDAIKGALEKILRENPEAFGKSGGGLLDSIGSLAGDLVGGGAKLIGGIGGAAKNIFKRKSAGTVAGTTTAKAASKGLGKTVFKSLIKKIPIIGAVASLGLASSRAMSGDLTGAVMEAGSGLAGTIPGIGTAASIGLDAALAARDSGVFNTSNPASTFMPELQLAPSSPSISPVAGRIGNASYSIPSVPAAGQSIIQMNQEKRLIERLSNIQTLPAPIVQRITNNTTLPIQTNESIRTSNMENTFNRMVAQDVDHPATYSNFYAG